MYKVVKVGFEKQNPVLSIILMDRKTREALKVPVGYPVTVSKNEATLEAVVMPQFKTLIGKGVTANVVLAKALQLKEGDEVEVKRYENPDGNEGEASGPRFPLSFLNN